MTIKELYAAIKQETMNVNRRLIDYYEEGKPVKVLDKEIETLKQISGTGKNKNYLSLNLHRKNKNQLTAQLNFLKQFQQWDVYTPEARREEEARARRAYRSFKQKPGRKQIKFKTYRRAVTILGSLSDRIINNFGSEQILAMVEYAFSKKADVGDMFKAFESVLSEFEQAAKDGTGTPKTPEDYVDRWYQIMNL